MKGLCLFLTLGTLFFIAILPTINTTTQAAPAAAMPEAQVGGRLPNSDVESAAAKIDARVLEATANGGETAFLLVLREQADLSGAAQLATKLEKGEFVLNTLRATAERTQPAVRTALDKLGLSYRAYYIVNLLVVEGGRREQIEQLAARADVARIEGDPTMRMPLPVPQKTLGTAPQVVSKPEWNIAKIHAPAVWAMGYKGRGIVYANADTGVQWTHPALKKHYRGWTATGVNHNYNWWDAVHENVSGRENPCGLNSRVPCDDNGHGTHTMGTGIGDDGRGNRIGVAPGAKWIACRNMDQGVGRPSQYIECFQFFLAPWNSHMRNPNPALNADVISNSWTCPLGAPPTGEDCTPDSLKAAVEAERAAGIMVVASAGNGGGAGCGTINQPPATYDASTTVGATDRNDNLAGLSSRGPVTLDGLDFVKPDLSAPGVQVRSSYPRNAYAILTGTSMAAPHVAGAVALLWSARPKLRGQIDQTEQALFKTAFRSVIAGDTCGGTTSSDIPNNLFGWGRVDVLAAVKSVAR